MRQGEKKILNVYYTLPFDFFTCVNKCPKIVIKNSYHTDPVCVCVCLGIAARETAQALKSLAQAARGVAASTMDPKAAAAMLDSARDVMEGSALLIHEAKQALISPGDAESQQRLAQVRCSGSLEGYGVNSACLSFYLL